MKEIKNKQLSKSAGVNIPRGGSGKMSKEQHTGNQQPGHTGVTKGTRATGIKADTGSGKMFGKQSVGAAPAGRTGKGGGGSSGGGKRGRKGYGGDASGNPY